MATRGEPIRRYRRARGLSQAALARRTGISRQALGAIEAGVYQPSVSVALSLARELGETVEALFGDEHEPHREVSALWAEQAALSVIPPARVSLARIAGRIVALPQQPPHLWLAPSAGTVDHPGRHRITVSTSRPPAEIDATLVLAGCDPAAVFVGDWLARRGSTVTVLASRCSSTRALASLVAGTAHIAGAHLRDRQSGEYNLTWARQTLGHRRSLVVNFARWELGLAAARGNPLNLRGITDLARPRLTIVNREPGSGSRAVLDEALSELGLSSSRIHGYQRELAGHLEVAAAVAAGEADAGISIRLAAQASGLDFIPLIEERYDLVLMASETGLTAVKAMLDTLNSARFAREISQFCAYDTSQMGKVLCHFP